MYEQYWGLKENPFKNTFDSRFFYISRAHQQALEMFDFVISQQLGVAMLSGLFGSGKTLLSHVLIERLRDRFIFCVITNPKFSPQEMLAEIAYQLCKKDSLPQTKIELLHTIEEALNNNLQEAKETIIIIDEAQGIEESEVFEELRLLLNLQSNGRPLFNLFLLGHSQLEAKISNNKSLSQRIAVRYHLDRLTNEETRNYLTHRLDIAGSTKPLFNPQAIELIYELSSGIPRKINNLCGMALFLGAQRKIELVDEATVREVNSYLIV